MKFLTKFGQIVLMGVKLAVGVQGAGVFSGGAAQTVQTVRTDLEKLLELILQAEVMGQALSLSGADKLKAVLPLVEQWALASSALVGHEIANPELFKAACEKIGSGAADLANSLKPNIQTVDKG